MRIPDRWLEYSKIGTRIPSTPFICCKTPLREDFSPHLEGNDTGEIEFTPAQLVEAVSEQGHDVRLVIDLTNTFRYYNGQQSFQQQGISYHKIKCEGHVVPSDHVFDQFTRIVNKFVEEYGTSGREVIVAHCTHGLNRTGYLVSRYLIEWLAFEPDDAIASFNDARGYPIERENYLDDLRSRPPEKRQLQLKQLQSDVRDSIALGLADTTSDRNQRNDVHNNQSEYGRGQSFHHNSARNHDQRAEYYHDSNVNNDTFYFDRTPTYGGIPRDWSHDRRGSQSVEPQGFRMNGYRDDWHDGRGWSNRNVRGGGSTYNGYGNTSSDVTSNHSDGRRRGSHYGQEKWCDGSSGGRRRR